MEDLDPDAQLLDADDAEFYSSLGRAVKVLRTHRGLSRRELAVASGLSYTYLAEIENGRKRLSAKSLLYVSRGLSVRPFEILSLAEAWTTKTSETPATLTATEEAPRPTLSDATWMLTQLRATDAEMVSRLIERLYRSDPERIPDSVVDR